MIINGITINTSDELRDLMLQQQYDFTDHVLINTDSAIDEVKAYTYETIVIRDASVPLNKIYGSRHPNYAGTTWRDVLYGAERIERRLQGAIDDPSYYTHHSLVQSDVITYAKINDSYYIEQGNHRTTIAKFLLPMLGYDQLSNVRVSEYKIDHELKDLIEELNLAIENGGFQDSVIPKIESNSVDADKWININATTMIMPYEIVLKVSFGGKKTQTFPDPTSAQTKNDIKDLIEALRLKRSFKRFFSSNKYLKLL